jgi:hypothetical protein
MALTPAERKRAQRARERAGLEEGEQVLRAVDDMLGPAIAETIAALELGPEHAAAVKLAERYAKCIDRAQDVGYAARWIGPLLLDALDALGATPVARARLDKGQKQRPAGHSWLDEMRQARRTYPGA